VTPIPRDVLEVLRLADARGQTLAIDGALDRKTYKRVDTVLQDLGGKWSRSEKAHVFAPADLAIAVECITRGAYVSPRENGYFPTPPDLVKRMVDEAGLDPEHVVLEPSAGQGAIADAVASIVPKEQIVCCEVLPRNQIVLAEKDYHVWGFDFLKANPGECQEFDRVLMNPPFRHGVENHHLFHAMKFLKPGGKLVAIMPSGARTSKDKIATLVWSIVDRYGKFEQLPEGSFKQEGTGISTLIVKYQRPEE